MIDRLVRRGTTLWRVAPGYLVVAAVDGTCVEMGGSADAVWAALPDHDADPVDMGRLVDGLAADFGVTAASIVDGVNRVIDALEAMGGVDVVA